MDAEAARRQKPRSKVKTQQWPPVTHTAMGVSAVIAGVAFLTLLESGVCRWQVLAALFGCVVVGGVHLVSRVPVVTAAVTIVCAVVSPALTPLLWLSLFRAGCTQSFLFIRTMLACSIAAIGVQLSVFFISVQRGETPAEMLALSVFSISLAVGSAAAGSSVGSSRRRHLISDALLGAALTRELTLERETTKHVRRQLGREMHDTLGLRLAVLRIYASSLQTNPGFSRAEIERVGDVIANSSQQAIEDLHEIIAKLGIGQEPVEMRSLEEVLTSFTQACHGRDLTLQRDVTDDLSQLPPRHQIALITFFSETLTNVLKYAGAGQVTATTSVSADGSLTAVVSSQQPQTTQDDLSQGSSRIGLKSLKERAAALGGGLQISTEDGRFTVTMTIPPTHRSEPDQQPER